MARIKPLKQISEQYITARKFPTSWCPGCGIGMTMGGIVRAIDQMGVDRDLCTFVVGIGCYGGVMGYIDFDELHVAHGRSPALATGLKLMRPELNVICVVGDGDVSAIGGNHLIHAARRNIDITVVVMNNHVYGMTGGQYSPTTRKGDYTQTTPYGMMEPAFDICKLVEAAGATFVARTCTYRMTQMIDLIEQGMRHKGFALIEVESQCPVIYGRLNRLGSAVDMLRQQAESTVTVERAKTMTAKELEGKIITGVLVEKDEPEYVSEYYKLIERAATTAGNTAWRPPVPGGAQPAKVPAAPIPGGR